MRVEVNAVKLYFDVDGEALTPDGDTMRERPTLILSVSYTHLTLPTNREV